MSFYPTTVLADSPVAYYRLGEPSGTSAADATGHGNDGTYTGGVSLGAIGAATGESSTNAGIFGSSFVQLPAFNNPGSVTIEAWVRGVTSPGQRAIVSMGNDGVSNFGAYLFVLNGFVTLGQSGTIGSQLVSSIPLPSDTAWHHIVAVSNGGSGNIYIDGVDVTTGLNPAWTDSGQLWSIGEDQGGTDNLGATIGEVVIYLGPLGSDRVAAHYKAARFGNLTLSYPNQIINGIAGQQYYRLGERVGGIAFDASTGQMASYTGSPTFSVAGALVGNPDTATTFDGSSQYVTTASTDYFNGRTAFTLLCWVQFTSAGGQFNVWGNDSVYIGIAGGTAFAQIGATFTGSGTPVLNDNKWHFLVAVFDGTNALFYIDGVQDDSQPCTGPGVSSGAVNAIAVDASGFGNLFPGNVDEVALSPLALTSFGVTLVFNAGAGIIPSVGTANGLATAAGVGVAAFLSVGTANGLATALGVGASIGPGGGKKGTWRFWGACDG